MAFGKKSVPVSHDILREKKQQVEALARQAEDAVEIVTRTMNRLDLINQHLAVHAAVHVVHHTHIACRHAAGAEQRKDHPAKDDDRQSDCANKTLFLHVVVTSVF